MPLTPKQARIATLLAQGHTAQEVANKLCRALPTVRRHIQIAVERNGVRNTTQLIALATSRGWIAPLLLALVVSAIAPQQPAQRVRQPVRIVRQVRREVEVIA